MKNILRIKQILVILNMVFAFCILFLANVPMAGAGVKDDRINAVKTKSEELNLHFIEKTAELLSNYQDLDSKINITVTDAVYCAISRSQSYVTTLQGAGTQESPYLIYTAQELDSIRNILNQPVYYKLMSDIDLSAFGPSVGGWIPIGYYNSNDNLNGFNGFFDGNNHVINGLYINSDLACLGLFGYTTSSSEINNIILEDMDVSTAGSNNSYVGGLVGWASGSICNSHVTGSVSSSSANYLFIGGLVGYADGSTNNCTATVNVSSAFDSDIGGLVGAADGSISNCYATGSVSSSGSSAIGGLVGYTRGSITDSHATASVSSSFNSVIGGLVGSISNSISNSYATGSVSSTGSMSTSGDFCNIGGLVGSTGGNISNSYAAGSVLTECDSDIGGLVGYTSSSISNSFATGSVSSSSMDYSDIGGLVGYSRGNISNSYATGSVSLSSSTSDSDIGGLVGFDNGSISNCYATGTIAITSGCVGGIAGWSRYGYIYDSYWDIDTTGQNSCTYNGKNGNSGNNGKHTAEMQQQSTFTGWDFSNIWKIHEGTSYPFLFEPPTNSKETLGVRSYCLYGKGSVNLSTGNFIFAQTDLSLPSVGPSLEFTRFYNSQDDYTGTQGKGWTNNFNVHLTINQDNSISVAYDDGHVYTFTNDGTSYVRPSGCFEILTAGPDNSYTLTFKDQTKYNFSNIGQLTSITDKNNNTLTLTYTNGLLTLASEPTGRTISLSYDSNNRLNSVTDSAGRSVSYTYDGEGNLATVEDILGYITQYRYDSHGLTEIIDPDNIKILDNEYDNNSMVIRQTDGRNNITGFNYDLDNRQTTITDALGRTTAISYDEKFRNTGITFPGNIQEFYTYDDNNCRDSVTKSVYTIAYDYDDFGNLLKITDPALFSTNMTYDAQNNLKTIKNADNKEIIYDYDANGNLETITDPFNYTTTYQYYDNGLLHNIITPDDGTEIGSGTTSYTYQDGLLKTVTDPAGNITTYNYDTYWHPASIIEHDGKITTMHYDEAGQVLDITDPMDYKISYTYDWRGNVLTYTDARGYVTRYFYNNVGKLSRKLDALDNETLYDYNELNQLKTITDPRHYTTTYDYDDLGRLNSITDPLGHTVSCQYDDRGNVIGETDALNKQVLTVTYDSRNNPETIIDALGNELQNEYDNLSRLRKITDPADNITEFDYDDLNRLKTTTDPLLGLGQQTFDAHGNLKTMEDPNNNQNINHYDTSDRLTGSTNTSGITTLNIDYNTRNLIFHKTNARGQTTTYHYYDNGMLQSYNNPDGTTDFTYDPNGNLLTAHDSAGTITCQYDELNRIETYTDAQGNTIGYGYDANGNLETLTYPGGRQVHYQYNALNQLEQVTDWANRITTYEYDPNGRLKKTIHPNGAVTSCDYDDAGRLLYIIDEDRDGQIISRYDYTYNNTGNIQEEYNSNENLSLTMDDAVLTYAFDNRLDTYNGYAAVYDADGNMTYGPLAGNMVNFTYDARSRLTGAGNTTYTYDVLDNRIQASNGEHQINYIVNPNAPLSQVLIQSDGQNNQIFYIYGLGLIGQEDEGGVYRSYHFDCRGSTIALTDESCQVTDHFQYAPYGELVYRNGNTATPFMFVGRYGVMTDGSDLYYMRARYYNPVGKRFLSPDTLTGQVTNPQSQNRYIYCEGNPVLYVDPKGHEASIMMSTLLKYQEADVGTLYNKFFELLAAIQNKDAIVNDGNPFDTESLRAGCEKIVLNDQFQVINLLYIKKGDQFSAEQKEGADALLHELIKNEQVVDFENGLLNSDGNCGSGHFVGFGLTSKTISDDTLKWLNKGDADNVVYCGMKNGEGVYTGITKQDLAKRLYQHNYGSNGKGLDYLEEQLSGLTRNQTRAIEQYIIKYGPANAMNQINSISPNSPYYNEALLWAENFLNGLK